MAAATYYFEINQGETFDQEFVWADSSDPPVPYDLTGWTVRFQARSESGVIILDTGGTPTSGLSATISALLGKVTVSMTPACTSAIPCPGRYAIELTQTSPATGRVKRLVEGSFTLSLETNR